MNKKLKIGFIFTNFPIPGALWLYDRITGLIELGHEVELFAFKPQKDKVIHTDVVKYDLLSKTTYHGSPIYKIETLKKLFNNFFKNPVRFLSHFQEAFRVSINNRKGIFNSYFFIETFYSKANFDCFFIISGPTANNLTYLKKLFPKTKFIVNFVGFDFSSKLRQQGVRIYDELFKVTDLIVTHSNFSKDVVDELCLDTKSVVIQNLGIKMNSFIYKRRDVGNEINIITVGRLVEKKAHRIILKAIEILGGNGYSVKYHIVGNGNLKENIILQINKSNYLKNQVIMHGYKNRDEIIDLLHRSHIFVQPSVSSLRWADMEDTTTTLIEAQATGMPVIATYHAGIPDVVKNNETGVLIPERNVNSLVDAILFFIKNPDKINEYGLKGRSFVENRFNNENLSRKFEHTLLELCNK